MPPMLYNRAGILIPPTLAGFLLGGRTVYTSGANTYTPPRYCKLIFYQLQGAGGGGRNCANSSSGQIVLGGGGSSGGYAEGITPIWPRSWTVTVGGGGSGATGASGGNSSINIPAPGVFNQGVAGVIAQATGGAGGGTLATGTTTVFIAPVLGATGSNSQLGISPNGHVAFEAHRVSGTVARSGRGADSFFGPGGRAVIAHGAGNNGSTGGGGSGGMSVNAAGAVSGGNGGDGIAILWEYY